MTGFVAGMPFLGDIDKKIQLNRLETPRVKVPKGSVGLTEQFCNIYTFESPRRMEYNWKYSNKNI